MKIKFKNGRYIKSISDSKNNIRNERWNKQIAYWNKHPDKFMELIRFELLPYQRIILKSLLKIEEKEMYEIVENEYSRFLQDVKDGSMIFVKYIDESEYEDEYSYNDIGKAQGKFIEKVKEYLHENYPGKYVVSGGWCVFVMTPDRARESHVPEKIIELFTVK